jgi:serine/threonine-protein kinase
MVIQSGYELGTISEISVDSAEKGRVVQQFPAPDSIGGGSRKIDILVSLESTDRYIMPDVMGQNLNRVRFFFEKNGFKLGKVQYANYQDVPRGSVVKQFPEPGYVLAKNYFVNLEVAR